MIVAMDHRADEFLLAHSLLEFRPLPCPAPWSAARRARRKRAGCRFTTRREIVGFGGQRDRLGGVGLLGARRGQRQHLHVDAGGVHLGEAARADIGELGKHFGKPAAGLLGLFLALAAGAFEKFRRGEMLFERDRSHVGNFLVVFVGWVERSIPIVRCFGCPLWVSRCSTHPTFYSPRSFSALPWAMRSRSPADTGICCRKATACAID